MKARLWIGSAVGALFVVAYGCSSPPPPDGTVVEFCDDWANAYCQLSTYCAFDATTCETYQNGVCMQFAQGALASGTRQYSQPNGATCINKLNSTFANSPTSVSPQALATIQTLCNAAFIGAETLEKPCTNDYDCVAGLTCVPYLLGSGSVCATLNPVPLNAICADPGDVCEGDSYCAFGQGSKAPTCIPTPTTGNACSAALPCGPEDHCVGGTCMARSGVGGPCESSADCSTLAPYCDTYPPAGCTVVGLTFARGSIDCKGISGSDPPTTSEDAGAPSSSDSGSGSVSDAASGG